MFVPSFVCLCSFARLCVLVSRFCFFLVAAAVVWFVSCRVCACRLFVCCGLPGCLFVGGLGRLFVCVFFCLLLPLLLFLLFLLLPTINLGLLSAVHPLSAKAVVDTASTRLMAVLN